MTRILPAGRYGFDSLSPGDQFETQAVTITAELIDRFADLTGDRFEIHMDDAAARQHGFPARVAHGLLVPSLLDGLKNQCAAQFDAIASLGWEWKFSQPVFIGDRIQALITVAEKRETSKPDRGIVTLAFAASNQAGTVVQQGVNRLMVYR